MPTDYALFLARALARTPACVGLDPVLEKLPEPLRAQHWEPARAIEHFCRGVLDSLPRDDARAIGVVKPQAACFERYGSQGWVALEHTVRHARDLGLVVILDAKRGDIGVSAEHYAAAAVNLGAHAITVNAYLGPETAQPYLDAGLGVFALVRTSNPGSDVVQRVPLASGENVGEMMARHVAALGIANDAASGSAVLWRVGAVVGATKADEGESLRRLMPDTPLLIPGYGAQGGTADDVARLIRPGAVGTGHEGIIVNSSRGVLYPPTADPARWQQAVTAAAQALVDDLARMLDTARHRS